MEMEDWGTWEELILVSAVMRHGTFDWEAVVAELRARTFAPGKFTAEVCKEKYEDLQQHYSACLDLLEELRKKRIAELRRTLEKSDGSIGFLHTKLKSLKAEKDHSSSVDYQSSPSESPAQTSVGQSSGKEASKDGLSAGSYTQEIWSPPVHVLAAQTNPQQLGSSQLCTLLHSGDIVKSMQMKWGASVRRKRGKRKRRGSCQEVREENIDETVLDSPNPNLPLLSWIKVEPTSECILGNPLDVVIKLNLSTDGLKCDGLSKIFDLVSSIEYASIFQKRLDSQKLTRYRKIVRQHLDLDAIKSRIDKQAITSAKELLRDLLLLATNTVTFYSRTTREHKYAVVLRGIIKKLIMECNTNSASSQIQPTVASPASATEPCIPPANPIQMKPVSANPSSHKSPEKINNDENIGKPPQGAKKARKPKDSQLIKTFSQTTKVNRQAQNIELGFKVSRQQPQGKTVSLKSHKSKDGLEQQPRAKKVVNAIYTKDGSKQRPLAKLANLNVQNIKEGSKQPKRAYFNGRNCKDGSRQQQPQVKSASINDSKERKRARKI